MSGTISGTFGWDNSPLIAGMKEAERQGASTSAQIVSELSKIDAATKRTTVNWKGLSAQSRQAQEFMSRPRGRTAADFMPAPKGKYPVPEEEAGGAGIGRGIPIRSLIAAGGVHQVLSMMEQAAEKASKLREEINGLTTISGPGAFRGFAELNSNLTSISEKVKEIGHDRAFDKSSLFRRVVAGARDLVTGESDDTRQEQKSRLRKQASKDISDLAAKQGDLNEAEKLSLLGKERESELAKEEISHKEKIGELAAAEAAAGVNNPAARKAEMERNFLARAGIQKKFDEQEQAKREQANREFESLASHHAEEAIRAREENQRDLEQANREFEDSAMRESAPAIKAKAESAAALDEKFGLFNAAGGLRGKHFGMSGQLLSGVDPITGGRVNMPQGDALATTHMASPTHMTKFGGSDAFNKFFHKADVSPQSEPGDPGGGKPLTKDGLRDVMKEFWEGDGGGGGGG